VGASKRKGVCSTRAHPSIHPIVTGKSLQNRHPGSLNTRARSHTAHTCVPTQLPCGASHLVHAGCAAERLQRGYPGPEFSFGYLFCPLCGCEGGGARGSVQVATSPSHLDLPALQGLQVGVVVFFRRFL
jgi:hypothetical protein